MLHRSVLRIAAGASRRQRRDVLEATTFDLFDEMSVGALAPRPTDSEWKSEEARFDSLQKVSSSSYKRFIPESVREWTRIKDRDAGDDDLNSFRGEKDQIVMDTKLLKGKAGSAQWAAVKTAGIDTITDIIENSKSDNRPELWESIVSRIEYLSSTLSVKKIRIVLDVLSRAITENPDTVPPEKLKGMVRALGQELLCRYHSMTMYSCSSIAKSLANLSCKDTGTLNVIALCFKQNVDKTPWSATDTEVTDMAIDLMKSFEKLGHVIPVIVDSVTAVASQVSLPVDKKIQILVFIVTYDESDQRSSRIESFMVNESTSGIELLSGESIVLLAKIAPVVGEETFTAFVRALIIDSVEVSSFATIKESLGTEGRPTSRRLSFGETEILRNCLGADSILRNQLDRILA